MTARFRPVDLLTFAFLAFLAAVTIVFWTRIPHGAWLLGRFLAVVLAILLLARRSAIDPPSRPARILQALLPVLVIPVLFDSMGDIIPWVRTVTYDEQLIRIDLALFRVHPTIWLEQFIRPWLTTILQLAYISYYPLAAAVGIVLLARGRWTEFDEALFGILLCFYLSYAGYLLVPAVGPRFTLAHIQTGDLQAGPLVLAVQEALNRLENTKTDAFPSGHTAVALLSLWYAGKMRERALFAVLVPVVTGLVLSTVYLRYHYVIDVIAGMALTLLTIWLAPKLYPFFLRAAGQARDQFHRSP
jgi:membrane-associated phospholipid phosphatase